MEAEDRAQAVKLLVLDVDGVLTAGHLFFDEQGEKSKVFHVQDGLGIAAAQRVGLKVAVISGRDSQMVSRRCAELGIAAVFQGVKDKVKVLEELAANLELTLAEICFVGDDLNDLAVLAQVGLACGVANAAIEVKDRAHFVSKRPGGAGAVREIIEFILKAQHKWATVVASYYQNVCLENKQ